MSLIEVVIGVLLCVFVATHSYLEFTLLVCWHDNVGTVA